MRAETKRAPPKRRPVLSTPSVPARSTPAGYVRMRQSSAGGPTRMVNHLRPVACSFWWTPAACTVAAAADSSVECWGSDDFDQASPPPGEFASISVGWGHNCGLRRDGSVECWGSGAGAPDRLPSDRFVSVSAGGFLNTCGITDDGTVTCWGHQMSPPQLPAYCHSDYSQEVTEEQDRECRLIEISQRHYEPPEGRLPR